MVDKTNKSRKGFITEEDIATLLQRYTATTVLTLLQEVARSAGPKIDWNELVKKTSTGITNAREYQMLWRHLAYRDSLLPVQDGAELLDDDSDLEYELEVFPHVNDEASTEAAAHVKVMAASYLPSETNIPNSSTVEAPLTINIPNVPSHRGSQGQSPSPWSTRGVNITVPVSLQMQNEGSNGNGLASGSMARRKRKKWSSDEDLELIAAVEKCGEGNWANILKGDFKGDRTASQLSQRWALIRKKRVIANVGTNQSGLQRTEAQVAANHALSLAVGHRAPSKNLTAGETSSNTTYGNTAEAPVSGSGFVQVLHQSQPNPVQTSIQAGALSSVAKSRVIAKKTASVSSNLRSDSIATANTVAAAACMAGPASVTKVEPVKNHEQSGGSSLKLLSNSSPVIASGSEGAVSKTIQHAPSTSSASSMPSVEMNALAFSAAAELPSKPKAENIEESKVSTSENMPKEQTKEDGASFLVTGQQGETGSTNPEIGLEKQAATPAESHDSSLSKKTVVKSEVSDVLQNGSKESQNADESIMMGSQVNGSESRSTDAKEKVNNKQEDCSTVVTNGYSKKPEVAIKPECVNGV